jgi:hypothetical protein
MHLHTVQGVHRHTRPAPGPVTPQQLARRVDRQETVIRRLQEYVARGENVRLGHPAWVKNRLLRSAYRRRKKWEDANDRMIAEAKRRQLGEPSCIVPGCRRLRCSACNEEVYMSPGTAFTFVQVKNARVLCEARLPGKEWAEE